MKYFVMHYHEVSDRSYERVIQAETEEEAAVLFSGWLDTSPKPTHERSEGGDIECDSEYTSPYMLLADGYELPEGP